MKLCEYISANRANTPAPSCPLSSPVQGQTTSLKPRQADRVTFGMGINWKATCCAEKVKTGRQGGCCAGTPHAKFVEQYRAAVERETEKTGIRPKLDADLQAVLDGKSPKPAPEADKKPVSKPAAVAAKSAPSPAEPPKELLLRRVLMAPVRFIKWFLVGLWEDLKLLFGGKKPE
ncbi:MAG: hypothetical protein K0Q50_3210 [Vampirovibrio sp.]|jgi:hypothetical protein|nr:hypothetical protein [Vampirovibrio sp.]